MQQDDAWALASNASADVSTVDVATVETVGLDRHAGDDEVMGVHRSMVSGRGFGGTTAAPDDARGFGTDGLNCVCACVCVRERERERNREIVYVC